jgi:hypothetical protein
MELPKLIEEKRKEVQDLEVKLEKVRGDLEKVKEKFPPIWSGNIKELNKFITDLEKWIKNPQLKRVRDLIENLKQQTKDSRSFTGLSEEYLISSLDSLESIVTQIAEIENDSLRANAVKKILDTIYEEKDFKDLLQTIHEYWIAFQTFKKTKVDNEFADAVKNDLEAPLIEPKEFSTEQITSALGILEKASRALELLARSGVTIQAYKETYMNSKSVDKVWEYADNIRNLLRRTFQQTKEIGEPFKEISDLLGQRTRCISGNSLNEINEKLKENDIKIDQWKKQAQEIFEEEYNKIKTLVEFAELENNVDQLFAHFIANLEALNLDDSYEDYEKLQEIKHRAIKLLEGKISEHERNIIENMGKANELVDEMGDVFWEAVKSLRDKQLIKIKLESGM